MRQIPAQVLDAESLEELESGNRLVLIRGGKPIAEIVPLALDPEDAAAKEQRRMEAAERLKAIMDKGFDMGVVWNGRDELYDRD